MIGVIVTGHGNYGSGLYSALKLIAGESENVLALDFTGDGIDEYDKSLRGALDKMKAYDACLILTDIAGGTPFNRSVIISQEYDRVEVLTGSNFQMLYTAAYAMGSLEEALEDIVSEGKKGISHFQLENTYDDEDDDEE